jgi:hypothetical protein
MDIDFFSFCLDGLLLRMLVFPILSILPGDRLQQISRGQKAVRYSFYVFIGLMYRMGIMTYKIVGLEKLNRPGQLNNSQSSDTGGHCFFS